MKKRQKKTVFWSLTAVAVLVLVIWLVSGGGGNSVAGQYDVFAQCLTDKGVRMYGAYWCPHCQNEKKAFGDSWQYVDYIECSLPGGQGQTVECQDVGIRSYPTWEFGDGVRQSGELGLTRLSELTGCLLESETSGPEMTEPEATTTAE